MPSSHRCDLRTGADVITVLLNPNETYETSPAQKSVDKAWVFHSRTKTIIPQPLHVVGQLHVPNPDKEAFHPQGYNTACSRPSQGDPKDSEPLLSRPQSRPKVKQQQMEAQIPKGGMLCQLGAGLQPARDERDVIKRTGGNRHDEVVRVVVGHREAPAVQPVEGDNSG